VDEGPQRSEEAGGEARCLGEGGANDVQFSPDGSGIYFLSAAAARDGTNQLWKADAEGRAGPHRSPRCRWMCRPTASRPMAAAWWWPWPCSPTAKANEIACTVQRMKARRLEMHRHGVRPHLHAPLGYLEGWHAQPPVLRVDEGGQRPSHLALMDGLDGDCPTMPFGGRRTSG
jgi:hypothetical protein